MSARAPTVTLHPDLIEAVVLCPRQVEPGGGTRGLELGLHDRVGYG